MHRLGYFQTSQMHLCNQLSELGVFEVSNP
jgi:hypothetical protein